MKGGLCFCVVSNAPTLSSQLLEILLLLQAKPTQLVCSSTAGSVATREGASQFTPQSSTDCKEIMQYYMILVNVCVFRFVCNIL